MTLTSRVEQSRGAVVGVSHKDHVSGWGIVQGADNVKQRYKSVSPRVPLNGTHPIHTLCIETAPPVRSSPLRFKVHKNRFLKSCGLTAD